MAAVSTLSRAVNSPASAPAPVWPLAGRGLESKLGRAGHSSCAPELAVPSSEAGVSIGIAFSSRATAGGVGSNAARPGSPRAVSILSSAQRLPLPHATIEARVRTSVRFSLRHAGQRASHTSVPSRRGSNPHCFKRKTTFKSGSLRMALAPTGTACKERAYYGCLSARRIQYLK